MTMTNDDAVRIGEKNETSGLNARDAGRWYGMVDRAHATPDVFGPLGDAHGACDEWEDEDKFTRRTVTEEMDFKEGYEEGYAYVWESQLQRPA